MNKSEFLNTIAKKIEKYHLLNHSFYKAWNAGELDRSVIQEYAAQYFKHVSAFPRYLSSIHSNCGEELCRRDDFEAIGYVLLYLLLILFAFYICFISIFNLNKS